jgi:hypothetical protein
MKKRRKDRQKPTRFDARTLTADDRAALAAYERRRAYYEQAIVASNVIYHKQLCPICGFPTLDERGDYELCVVCQWEDDGDGDPMIIGPPNYTSMTQARIKIARMLAEFEQTHTIDGSLAAVVAGVRAFREAVGFYLPDSTDYAAYLRRILPVTPIRAP